MTPEALKLEHRPRRLLAFLGFFLVALLWPAAADAAPANDDFANALIVTGTTGSLSDFNIGATKEAGEPDHADNPGGHSVWYSWTAPADGGVAFTTVGSGFDTLLAAYTGASVNTLTLVAASDDKAGGGTTSTISFPVSNGITYKIVVDGFSGKVGSVNLSWHPAPPNDNFADAELLASTTSGRSKGNTTRGATIEVGEPRARSFAPHTIWYTWTAPADGTYKFDTFGSNFDTVLAVYTGSSLETLALVRRNDDDPDRGCCSSWVPLIDTTVGTTYSIAVRPFGGGGGSVVLRWSPLVLGTSASETLMGTSSAEELRGRGGNDVLRGLSGADAIFGGGGDDLSSGGAGSDFLFDRRGTDRLFGRGGSDRMDARDGSANDVVAGGDGSDICRADLGDTRRSC